MVYKNRIRLKEFFVDFDKVCDSLVHSTPSAEDLLLAYLLADLSQSLGVCLQLRTGFIFENQFMSGLSMAGLDKQLTPPQLQSYVKIHCVRCAALLSMVHLTCAYCADLLMHTRHQKQIGCPRWITGASVTTSTQVGHIF